VFNDTLKYLRRKGALYLFIIPSMVYMVIFKYIPMYGVRIAFMDYLPGMKADRIKWVGMKHFISFWESIYFKRVVFNTLSITVPSLIVGTAIPILLAILFHQSTSKMLKGLGQNLTYLPHFISTVVFVTMINLFLSKEGVINSFLAFMGFEKIQFLAKANLFSSIYVITGVWKSMGWNSIMYYASLTSVNPELYEAASIDGASKMQKIRYIDIPSILPVVIVMLILSTGHLMDLGYERVYLMQNSLNISKSEVISTFVYKRGIVNMKYSFSAAVGLFNSVINLFLLIGANTLARKVSEESLW